MFRLVASQPLVPFDILSCSEVCILLCEFRTYLTSTLVYTPLSEFIWTRENNQTYIQDDDCTWGFPGHASGKESACQFRRYRFNPCVRKIFWRRKWQPTPGLWHGNVKRVGQDWAQSAIGPRHFPRITISFWIWWGYTTPRHPLLILPVHTNYRWITYSKDFPGDSAVKHPPAKQETWVWSLGLEDPLEKETPLQYSCLGNPMGREALWATVHGVTKESDKT